MLHQTFLPQAARCPQEAPMSVRFQLGARVSVEDPNRRKCRQQNPQTYFPETAWFLQGAPMSACSQQKRKWKQSRPQKSFSHRAPSPLNVSSIKKCHVFFIFHQGAPHAALSPEVVPKHAAFPQGPAVPISLPQATTLPASFLQ